jgi:potassium efflux system protein
MNELLLEIFGWLGYLERPAVLLQLGLVMAVVLTTHLARRRRSLPLLAYTLLGLLALTLTCGVLAALGLPQGLASLLGLQWLDRTAIGLLHQPLADGCRRNGCINSNLGCCGRPIWWALPCC